MQPFYYSRLKDSILRLLYKSNTKSRLSFQECMSLCKTDEDFDIMRNSLYKDGYVTVDVYNLQISLTPSLSPRFPARHLPTLHVVCYNIT